jgi:acetyl-CoA acetyltransferase
MTIADYLASPSLADPLRLFDSCLISDGGAAYVTTSTERARDMPQTPAVVRGVAEGQSASGGHWSQQRDFTSTPQVFSAPNAFAMAGLTPGDVDVLTVYDPFTVVSLMQIEDMGFCPKGEAGPFVEGDTLFHDAGKLPFNTHGGLLSHAYVLGIAHVVEVVKQLRGTAPAPVPGCEVGVYGGYTGAHASTLVLTKG